MRTIKSVICALAVIACACGGIATYNLLVAPDHRIGGHRYDGIALLGPTIIGIGVLLFIGLRLVTGALPSAARIRLGRRLKTVAGILSVVPAALGWALAVLLRTEGAYLLLLGLVLFTGPGLCFCLFGGVLEAIGQQHRQNGTRKT